MAEWAQPSDRVAKMLSALSFAKDTVCLQTTFLFGECAPQGANSTIVLMNILLSFLLSFTGCPTVLENKI